MSRSSHQTTDQETYWVKWPTTLSAGINLVWVIDPERCLARVYRSDGTEQIMTADQALDGEAVVPGFACPLATIL